MEQVGVRELRQNASALLDRVRDSGVGIEITHHGRPVARLVPVPTDEKYTRDQLVALGRIRVGRGDWSELGGPEPDVAPVGTPPNAEILGDLGADRLT